MQLTKAIVTAMREEADIIIKKYNLKKIESGNIPNLIEIYEGVKDNNNEQARDKIVLALSGIGKIGATLAATYLFENYEINKIVNIGIAGNLDNSGDIKIGDVFLPNTFIQHDIYLPFDGSHLDYAKKPIFLDYAIGENYDLNKFGLLMSGVCVTGDQFIDDDIKKDSLRNDFGGDIVEMEAFAFLSVAKSYNSLDKCVVIKSVSDGADNDSIESHMNNLNFAMNNSVNVLELIL